MSAAAWKRPMIAMAGCLSVVGLLGCGSSDESTTPSAATTAPSSAPSTESSSSPPSTDAAAEPVEIVHAGGTTVLENTPSRVVVLDDAMLGDLSALGVTPVGIPADTDGNSMLSVWGADLGVDEIDVVAPAYEPNLEAIALVEPDLILAMAWQVSEPYWNDLSSLAPTIALETDVDPLAPRDVFTENLRVYGQIFRQEALAEAFISDYDEQLAAVQSEFAAVIEGATVSLSGSLDPSMFRVIGPRHFAGSLLTEIGFTIPQNQVDVVEANVGYPVETDVSVEETADYLNTDLIIWRDYNRSDGAVTAGFPAEALEANPFLAALPAAEAGHVFTVSNVRWYLRSVNGRLLVLDQLRTDILPQLVDEG